jgi:hopanoid C-3 methylase
MSDTIGLQHLMVVEPLELEILATLIRNKHEVRIVDMILEKKELSFFLNNFQPDVMCVTGYITHIPVIIRYCLQAKEFNRKIITITGGVHVEKYPGDIDHESIDFRVVRNATRSFPQLIDFISEEAPFPAGVLKKNEVLIEENLPEYDFFCPVPDRSLTAQYRKKYFYVFHHRVALVKTSFGCPYKCNFCFCRKITGDRYYARPLDDVIDELEGIKEDEIYIVDDDFLVSAKRIREFITLLKDHGLKKKFLVYGRADFIAGNPDLIRDFKKAGLRTVIVGLESFDDIELNDFNKQTTSSVNKLAMDVLNRNRVDCYAAVIVSPSWDETHFKRAGDIMIELGIKFVNLQPLTPLKGTGIMVDDKNLVVDRKDYAKWDLAHVTIKPEKLSVKDFYINILNLYLRILYHPGHLLYFLRYPVRRQWIMAVGLKKVIMQYKQRIMEVS